MIERHLRQLAEGSIARPRRTIITMIVAVAIAAPGLLRLELRTDGHALVPPGEPVVRFDAEVREHFGLRDPIVVFLETSHPDGVYNPATLRRLQQMSDAVAALPEVGPDQVTSLATEPRDRVYTGTLKFRPFLDPLPNTPELLDQVAGDVAAADILTGTLISSDHRALTLLVGVPAPLPRHRLPALTAGSLSIVESALRSSLWPATIVCWSSAPRWPSPSSEPTSWKIWCCCCPSL